MNGIIDFTRKHASTILSFLGASGVVATAVLAAKATPEAINIVKAEEERREKELTAYDKFKVAWKPYIPSILTGFGTISCIFGANIINKKAQASLMSSYALLSKYFNEYKYEANNTYSLEENHNANQVIQKALFERKIRQDPPEDVVLADDEILAYLPIYATTHSEDGYITTKKSSLLNLENRINDEIYKEGYCCINKVYKWLGMKNNKLPAWGWQYGWVKPYDAKNKELSSVAMKSNSTTATYTDESLEEYDDDIYKVKIELTKCTIDDNSMDCWFVDVICPPEMQSFC